MRLTIVILIASLLQVSASTFGQKITINKQDVPLKVLLQEIRKQSGYNFFYDGRVVTPDVRSSIRVKDATIDEALKIVLADLPLSYEIKDKLITISKKEEPSVLDRLVARFQAIDVRGRVVDENFQALSGASVTVKNGRTGVTTGADGTFFIKNVDPEATLSISFVGYQTKEVKVEGSTDIEFIQLQLGDSKLDEVQIQAYGKTSRRLSTGNIVTVSAAEIERQPLNNPLMALQGRVPNLVMGASSGLPNAPISLQIRGQNSLMGLKTEPLIVIDGIPYQNTIEGGAFLVKNGLNSNYRTSALSFINPADIAQIDVLVDADATSIYGSRGGNGVILITTKRGKAGATNVSFNVSRGFSKVANKLDLLDTKQYLELRKAAYRLDGFDIPDANTVDKNFTNYDLTLWDQNRYTDWQEKFLGKQAPFANANFSISGGVPTIQYLVSGTFNRQTYVFPGDNDYKNGTGHFSLTASSGNQKLKAMLSGSYTYNHSLSPMSDLTSLAVRLAPNAPELYTSTGEFNWEPTSDNQITWENPYATLLRTVTSTAQNFLSSSELSYRINDQWNVKMGMGLSRLQTRDVKKTPIASKNPLVSSNTGSVIYENLVVSSLTLDPQITYQSSVLGGVLEGLLGANYQSQSTFGEGITGNGFLSDVMLSNIGAAAELYSGNFGRQYKYSGAFGRLNFRWDDRYILNLTARRDGSSRFGPGYQFGNFWSTGASWIFSNETFIKKMVPWLSYGKLRGSYGSSGNDGISDYAYTELYNLYKDASYGGAKPLLSEGAINIDYHWEDIRKFELALEAGLLQDRLLFSAAYWETRAKDQLGRRSLPWTSGAKDGSITINQDAAIMNYGWDFTVNSKNLSSEKFAWSSALNFGIQNNKLLYLPKDNFDFGLNRFVQVGKPFNGFIAVYESRGVNPITGMYQLSDKQGNIIAGAGTQLSDFRDAKKVNLIPSVLCLSNSFVIEGIELNFFLEFCSRLQLNPLLDPAFNYPYDLAGSFNSQPGEDFKGNLPKDYLLSWKGVGDISSLQRLSSQRFSETITNIYDQISNSDLNWVDASYIKMRNVSLAYNFGKTILRRLNINGLQVRFSAQNVFAITKYKGLDPEIAYQSSLPLLRTIVAGISVKL